MSQLASRLAGPSRRLVTMADIGRSVGVSQSTVSRVLNGSPSSIEISDETRKRILQAARRLNYHPNPLARGLRGARTMLLGVIVRDITDPFFAEAVEAVSIEAMSRGYNVVLGHAHGRADRAIALRSVLETRHVDAILLLGDMTDQPRLIAELQGSRARIVALWQGTALPGVATVNVDNAAGISQAIDHLLAFGHQRIAFVGGRPLGDILARRAAYLDRMRAEQLPVPEGYVHEVATNDPPGGVAALSAIAGLPTPPTAVLCSTDQLAIGVLHEAARLGIRVPKDLSIVGFDDLRVSAFTVPPLSTVRMPVRDMATRAVEMAVSATPHSSQPTVHVSRPRLIVRTSTGPAANRSAPSGLRPAAQGRKS